MKIYLIATMAVLGLLSAGTPAVASVVTQYTTNTENIGQGGDTTANEYNGFLFYISETTTATSVTMISPVAQDNTGPNSMDYTLIYQNGTVIDTNTRTNLSAPAGTEYTIPLSTTRSLLPGYYFYGSHAISGSGVVKGRSLCINGAGFPFGTNSFVS